MIFVGEPLKFDEVHFLSELKRLEQAAIDESMDIKEMVASIIPSYHIRKEDKERDEAMYQELMSLGRASREKPVVGVK